MNVSTYQLFRGHVPMTDQSQRAFALIRCLDEQGQEGWGEIAPLPGFSRETLDEVVAEAQGMLRHPGGQVSRSPSLAWAVDTADRNLAAAQKGLPLCRLIREDAPNFIRVNALLRAEEAVSHARSHAVVKCKVGSLPIAEECDRLRKISARLRLDANRGLSLGQALRLVEALSGLDVEYIEEPVAAFSDLPAFIEQSHVPVALDETLREKTPAQLDHLDLGAIVYKPSLMGAWNHLMQWHAFALERGIKMTISAAYETGIGIWTLANVAAGLPGASAFAGLDTYRFLDGDIMEPRLDLSQARLELSDSFSTLYHVKMETLEEIPHG